MREKRLYMIGMILITMTVVVMVLAGIVFVNAYVDDTRPPGLQQTMSGVRTNNAIVRQQLAITKTAAAVLQQVQIPNLPAETPIP
jgi:hypothetical protein